MMKRYARTKWDIGNMTIVLAFAFAGTPAEAVAQQAASSKMHVCTAMHTQTGKDAPSESAAAVPGPSGASRMVDPGGSYYTSDNPADPATGWLDLFGAQNGHGSSWMGFYPRENFRCQPLEKVATVINTVKYQCESGDAFSVRYEADDTNDWAVLVFGSVIEITLPSVISGSGAKYSNDDITWHTKAADGLLMQGGREQRCSEVG